jgi:hypothetical protein
LTPTIDFNTLFLKGMTGGAFFSKEVVPFQQEPPFCDIFSNGTPTKPDETLRSIRLVLRVPLRSSSTRWPYLFSIGHSGREERWITLGKDLNGITLVIVHTFKEGPEGQCNIRVISARRATRKERKEYEEGAE